MDSVKSAFNIKKEYLDQLKVFVSEGTLNSLTDGINQAVYMFIIKLREEQYAESMKAAAADPDFMERTLTCQAEFDVIVDGAPGEW